MRATRTGMFGWWFGRRGPGPLWVLFLMVGAWVARASGASLDWRWAHPVPHGNNLAELVHRDGVYLHVTDHGGVYVSTNRVMWDRRVTGTLKDLRAATVFGGRWIVTGAEGTVLWSDDAVEFRAGEVTPATGDWFEGVAAGGGWVVAVGDNGAVYRSEDGMGWGRVAAGQFSEWLFGVAYGGGVFVVVGEAGLVATSVDGAEWVRRRSGVTADLTRVVYGDGRFLAVGLDGVVVTSANGTLWNAEAPIGSMQPLATAVMAPGERLVAGEGVMATRRTIGVWQDQLSEEVSPAPAPFWNYAAAVWDGARYLVGGRTGVLVESYRTNAPPFEDATFWLRQDDSPRNWLWDVARVGGTYFAVGDQATILSSVSGASWTLEAVPEAVEGVVWYGVGGGAELAVVVGAGGEMLRSPAGVTNVVTGYSVEVGGVERVLFRTNEVSLLGVLWEPVRPKPVTNSLQGVAFDGERFVVVGGEGVTLTGTNGTDWVRGEAAGREFLSSVAVSGPGGTWVACGARGALYTSGDGVGWERRNTGTERWVYRVRRVGDAWVAVGEGGLILTSGDGVGWQARASGTSSWLTGLAVSGGAVYACGTQGTVLRSTNLVDWVDVPTLTGKALNGMASNGPQIVVAGAEGVVLRAVAEPGSRPVRIGAYRHFRDSTPGIEALMFEGVAGQRFRWENGGDLGVWGLEAELELDLNGAVVVGRETGRPSRFHRAVTPP